MKNKRRIFIYILLFVCILNTGCDTQKAAGDKKKADIENNDSHSNSQGCRNIHLRDAEKYKVSVSDEKNLDMNVVEKDEYAQMNNNIINGNFMFPYKKGYLYSCTKDNLKMAVFYDTGEGNITEQRNIPQQLIYIHDNTIYCNAANGLKCRTNGKMKTIIKYQYSEWNSLYFADQYIYYTDIDEEEQKTYICRADYQGNRREKLYVLDVSIDQIYLYNNELWFVFHEFENIEKAGLGRVNCSTDNVAVYENIVPKGTSEAGNKISIANGCVYFNASGFKRLNIKKNIVEELFPDNMEGVNFAEDCIIFYKNKMLYKRDSESVKRIWKLKGKTSGFEGVRVENNKIYVQSYEGAFYKKISEINKQGKYLSTKIRYNRYNI